MFKFWMRKGTTLEEACHDVNVIHMVIERAYVSGKISQKEYESIVDPLLEDLGLYDALLEAEKAAEEAEALEEKDNTKAAVCPNKGHEPKHIERAYTEQGEVYGRSKANGVITVTVMGKARRISPKTKKNTKPSLVNVKANGVKASDIRNTEFSSIALRKKLFNLEGCNTYTQGTWIWVTGSNTKAHKDFLKSLKFRWSKRSQAWYLKDGIMNFAW